MNLQKIEPGMQPLAAGSPESQSADLKAENIATLKALFPELLSERIVGGKPETAINVDVLKQLVGDTTASDADEKYGLNWHGKRRARQIALTPSTGTLRPCPDESVDWDTTQNLMIEGDNLEVLKLLQKSYAGKVKLIYIDPPYNTGKDFVYPDNFQDNIKNYLELTGQIEGGAKITSNTEASGRFHTDWLNMIFPRLRLARNLLTDDGIVAISVDDTEVGNVRRALDEIFGEEQFQAQVIVQSNKRGQTYKQIAKTHEYLIVYSKSESIELNELEKADDALPFKDSSGAFDLWELRNRNPKFGKFNRPNLFFPIYVQPESLDECGYSRISLQPLDASSIKILPLNSNGDGSCWRWGREKIQGTDLNASSPVLVARKRRDGIWNIYEKSRKSTTRAKSIWSETEFINEQGTIELGRLEMGAAFDHPKPVALIQRCIFMATNVGDLVMDFFAGSGTTGHATLAQNSADSGGRRYILVQLPESLNPENSEQKSAADLCDLLGKPRTIAELTKERLRRAAKKIRSDTPLFSGDTGFRVFKLDTSNIRAWSPDRNDLEGSLLANIEHIQPGRSDTDVLYELLLKLGLDLCVPIETRIFDPQMSQVGADKVKTEAGFHLRASASSAYNKGFKVHSIGGGVLMACLESRIAVSEAEALALGMAAWRKEQAPAGDTTAVFRDSAFENDVAKSNLAAILQQHGIGQVRSL